MGDDDVDLGGPELPRGVVGRRRGWQGEEMEMEHQQVGSKSGKDNESAAVDISQFQNHVVGEGYQARHVVRQASANASSSMKIQDMSGGVDFTRKEAKTPKVDSGDRNYIDNAGLRDFRKEIEIILSSN